MADIVISVENVWKQYKLGGVNSYTLRDDLAKWWAKLRGREDPTQKIATQNNLNHKQSNYIWALQDINFEVKRGEVLGIIGKNGAGKSTLLKILAKITQPTKGQVKIKGRIASLLEVGTGFHPELTGRENIFLNGAILGLTKQEIKQKLDEIIAFSGIEAYIDTPVKRYSSGMYVRLAFAVAAHLEPEILIVDEVLAVGDAEFQKKCLGKMKDVSGEGRAVIFVSHNMAAVQGLCSKGILLKDGKNHNQGNRQTYPIDIVIKQYYENLMVSFQENVKNKSIKPNDGTIELVDSLLFTFDISYPSNIVFINQDFYLLFHFRSYLTAELNLGIQIYSQDNTLVLASANWQQGTYHYVENTSYEIICTIKPNILNEGFYYIDLLFIKDIDKEISRISQVLFFKIIDNSPIKRIYTKKWGGFLRQELKWETKII